ncbi:cytochrome c assembly protein [Thioalkalivibrio nitratireducens DSM 14787]|uniref:Cytochrome c assembly protein n=1 Tax=Thioalkalivibrio nitratireducens (strain DSM 14787 / UNIQEM 213 / ALEN2) TaxID=1255043 RepID=L0E1D7_THIND|nr:cytochrome c biogenesis protein CcsA [Thioalkalivibrio nitratireducens]AGA35062.1 cytochrome c assembly protein [Thioalkalivibrio nitratireducens DSM 14787]
MSIAIGLLAILLYLITTGSLVAAARREPPAPARPRLPLGIWAAALLVHLGALSQLIWTDAGLNLCLGNAVSASLWLVAALLWTASLRHPLAIMGVIVLPLTALALLGALTCSGGTRVATTPFVEIHIMLAALGWAFLALSTVQAAVMTAQHRALHEHHTTGFVRYLPPLYSMELWLFRMIFVGWVFLSLSLASGLVFLEDLFAQHLVHKSVLSILAWIMFSVLLFGRWRFGWRGSRALAWTTGGFVSLVLAYFGSKLVLEVILQRV